MKNRLSIKEAAKIMGCDILFLRNAIAQGKIPGAFFINNNSRRTFFINKTEFENWIFSRKEK